MSASPGARGGLDRTQKVVVIGVIALFVIVAGALVGVPLVRGYGNPVNPVSAAEPGRPQVITSGEPVLIGEGAHPIQLFIDFHCPHCADFEKEYGDLLFRAVGERRAQLQIYPMSFIDAGSVRAANAFGCATQAGMAEPYYRTLFANPQLRWTEDQLIAAAFQPSGSQPAFEDCVRGNANAAWVASISAAADSGKVEQTPTLIVDSRLVDLSTLTPKKLDAMLQGTP